MKRCRISLAAALLALTCSLAVPALAADAPGEERGSTAVDELHTLSLTVSPIHLTMPVLELTAEYRLNPKLGVAAIGGFGQFTQETTIGDTVVDEDTFDVFELGAQVRYYVVGDFDHGMQVGAEALWMHLSGDNLQDTNVSGSGAGLAVGPFIGYKIATSVGFTFDAQLGYQFLALEAEVEDDDTGATDSDEDSTGVLLLNLNVGWSF